MWFAAVVCGELLPVAVVAWVPTLRSLSAIRGCLTGEPQKAGSLLFLVPHGVVFQSLDMMSSAAGFFLRKI
jgi:hypothetical protein